MIHLYLGEDRASECPKGGRGQQCAGTWPRGRTLNGLCCNREGRDIPVKRVIQYQILMILKDMLRRLVQRGISLYPNVTLSEAKGLFANTGDASRSLPSGTQGSA
jgi:hypothetical protein